MTKQIDAFEGNESEDTDIVTEKENKRLKRQINYAEGRILYNE